MNYAMERQPMASTEVAALAPPYHEPERPIEGAQDALNVILDTAEYLSDRATHLSTNAAEGIKAGDTLSAVARQIRTLSSNTSLEAARLGGSATVAEIARQMRLLSQQVTVLSEHLTTCLRSQNVALGELGGAIDALLADTATTQALLAREEMTPGRMYLADNMPETTARPESTTHG